MKLNTLFALTAVTGAVMACASGSGTMSSQSASPTPSASAATGEWVNLIDPKLTAWRGYKEQTVPAGWQVINGDLNKKLSVNDLITKNEYGDFQLTAEFWVGPDANSGIFIRATDPKNLTAANAYEVNIWDDRPEKDYATGAIVGVAKVNPMPETVGKWSTYEITAKGGTFTVVLNGKKTVDGAKDDKLANGKIALQHGLGNKDAAGVVNDKGVVKFRKVEIKKL